ncbi:MAG: molybdenum cofactor guanylyltransferase [Bacteroidetes bacterium]|nr:molybdenum cofactor guanylyltransferase [Bacteroidota bacterium]
MLNNISDITAIILCGGKSKRMGIEKGLLELNGERVIERIFKIVSLIFNKILLSTNDPNSYSFLGVPMVGDYCLNCGPLGGIHAGLNNSTTEKNFIISCDMPFISEEAIRYLTEYKSEAEILLPKADGRIQYLCGIYSKSILPDLEKFLSREQLTKSVLTNLLSAISL